MLCQLILTKYFTVFSTISRSLFPGFYPSIKITSPFPFSVSNLKVETKHAKMVILVAFSDITGNEVLFTSSVSLKLAI